MDPQQVFCPNASCPARGVIGEGNIGIHSRKEGRYRCRTCDKTFAATTGTPFYRRQYPAELISQVVSLLGHGCPLQAIVATFELDERTVTDWQRAAGCHCQAIHAATIEQGELDLQQVQADEIRVKVQGGVLWLALAIAVSTRLWLGGTVSATRDTSLVLALVLQVKACALCRPLLICCDGFVAYVKAFQQGLRTPWRTGKPGRPRLIAWPDVTLVRVVKQYARRRVVNIKQVLAFGDAKRAEYLLAVSQGGGVFNVAYIERLNATFRSRLATLVRRGRALARTIPTVENGMHLIGSLYNYCTYHQSLRLPLYIADHYRQHRRWVQRTPAMAAGLTDHRWSVLELLNHKVPPPPYVPPKRRGRPPKSVPSGLAL
jgi:transposase-like protein